MQSHLLVRFASLTFALLLLPASVEAKKARENANRATAAAKRALSDGVYLHTKAKEQYQAINNLNKHIVASDKVARNLELLINEGLVLPLTSLAGH